MGGLLSWFVPPGLADEVAARARAERDGALAGAGGKVARRRVRLLPPQLTVYFTLALCLSAHLPYQEVMRGLAGPAGGALALTGRAVPAVTALTAARRRLGARALELLFWQVAGPLMPSRDPWATACGLLLAAWDGTTLDVAASPENTAAFGRPRGGVPAKAGKNKKDRKGSSPPAEGHYPHARLVALATCGTRALLGAAIGPLAVGEQKLAASLAGRLRPGMLLPADRGFYSRALWKECAATGAHLLWRVKSDIRLPVRKRLPDGSWLSSFNDTRDAHLRAMRNANRRARASALPQEHGPLPGDVIVRVIEFLVTITSQDGATRTQRYRAVTTLPDWRRYPAPELAAACARRWDIESCYRDLKQSPGQGRVLRSRTPDLARQEIWALLIAYQAIRAIICHAAAGAGQDPRRLSFTTALHAARRALPGQDGHAAILAAAAGEILAQPLPARPPRASARVIAERTRPFPSRRSHKQPLPQRIQCAITTTTPGTSTQNASDQHEQARNQPAMPP